MEQEAPATTTERVRDVTLRLLDLADADAMMAWVSDPEVTTFMTWDPYTSRDALLAFLRDAALPHPWFRAVCLPGGDHPVGSVSVSPTADACRAELGYMVARAHWGKGVATAAVRRARVEALVDVRNVASQRMLEKARFRQEAVLRRYCVVKGAVRDMAIYSFISTDALLV
ncbi:hypothetical protein CFC21_052909 [Triticum aestivum]|uniref:N-acetyltransferase domain-containing protein n=2 Tax=Triticum aestivum TaxID=4565 RepID=A0A9R1GBK0_WHEAT|nr:hypothetical protein CFC21_052909 [Triticum aestivum]